MMMATTAKANGFLKDFGIYQNLSKYQTFEYGGVEFEYVENNKGVGTLFFNGMEKFGGNTYTNMAIFDHGAAVRVFDTDGNRSTKASFKSDLESAFKDKDLIKCKMKIGLSATPYTKGFNYEKA